MARKDLVYLGKEELQAVEQFYNLIIDRFRDNIVEIRLFGSKVRGTSDTESDIDILILVKQLNQDIKEEIIDMTVDVNLQNDVLISPIIIEKQKYFSPLYQETLFFKATQEEGVAL
ncbi:nucleotidyltransferase domain-containing protein [Thermoanaerobacteraceae bacterium SP2]|nr:uncharacterized protein [Petrotoga sp.]RKL63281.1 nucleotidyltransferase domain-containing protein [Thermoanaerobacteraceae bacterium SP2]